MGSYKYGAPLDSLKGQRFTNLSAGSLWEKEV